MEEIFIAIMERIAEKIPELSYIDEDYGQLEAGAEEDHYPVTFPCVLIGNAESDWNDLGYGVQKSESLITIRLAIDCYDDTHYTSGTYDKVRERQLKAKELYKALKQEKEYHVVALARNKEEALSMIVGLMECLVERDPQLRRMKETIGEIYR